MRFVSAIVLAIAIPAFAQAPSSGAHSASPEASPATTTPATQTPANTSATQSPEALARQYVDLWNTGNLDSIKSSFSGFFMTSHGHRVAVDLGMLSRVISFWRRSMPDLNFKIEDTLVDGDKVAMRLSMTGTYKVILFPNTTQPGANDPPKKIRATEMLIFRMKNGKINEVWEEYDEMVMRVQMGGQWVVSAKGSTSTFPGDKPLPSPEP